MIENSERIVLVSDGSTLDTQSFVKFADFEDLDMVITETTLSFDQREPLETINVNVIERAGQ